MRFSLSVAFKYLIPRRRQLSVSIISLLSVFVISLVVWLAIVFLSVTEGIEKKWVEELVSLHAPLKIRPTNAYFDSYYYQIDALSEKSDYRLKNLGEKIEAVTDPYDPLSDRELPADFPLPEKNERGATRDLVKELKRAIDTLSSETGFRLEEFESALANLHLTFSRNESESFITQVSYFVPYDEKNRRFEKLALPATNEDLVNIAAAVEGNGLSYVFDSKQLPKKQELGEAILLPKGFKKNGALIGDRGYVSFYVPSTSGLQEQRLPVYIAGFYDPGMMPIGNKLVLSSKELPPLLKTHMAAADEFFGNGFSLWVEDLSSIEAVKQQLQRLLEENNLKKYFTVESLADFEFSRPFLEQIKSDKVLFTFIALIILIVACSNIISMLILLVNDKKKEIGIFHAMGATPKAIAAIFGLCGFMTGLLSAIFGTLSAYYTLKYLKELVQALSFLQGREAFQSAFYGNHLPNSLSISSLLFVVTATLIISLLAGIIPARKAARLRPTEILRAE